jgi:hypothetical protein
MNSKIVSELTLTLPVSVMDVWVIKLAAKMEETFTRRRETLNCFHLFCPRGSKFMKIVLSFISFLSLYFTE